MFVPALLFNRRTPPMEGEASGRPARVRQGSGGGSGKAASSFPLSP